MKLTQWMAVFLAASLFVALPANAQYYVQGGNALDANNRVGSGGLNYGGVRDYRINYGNNVISGNSTGGTAFRGYSPIRDSNSLFLGVPGAGSTGASNRLGAYGGLYSGALGVLPSDRLTSFRRDSYGITDPRRSVSSPVYASSPYYSQTSAVTNTGQIISGYNQPGTSQLRSDYTSLRTDYRIQPTNPLDASQGDRLLGNPLSVDPRLVRAQTTGQLSGQVNQRLLNSPLFAGIRQVPLSEAAAGADRQLMGRAAPVRQTVGTENVGRENMRAERSGSALDRLLGTDAGTEGQPGATPKEPGEGTLRRPVGAGTEPMLARPINPQQESNAPNMPPGWRFQVPVDQPLSTFVGTQEGRFKEQLAAAEEMLRQNRYYDAARRYEMAHAIDMENPLPLFGRAMALLAAGDYVTSSNDLFMAISQAGGRTAVQIDLSRFVPDLGTLDRRRAFLENRLQTVDDFRLRFLLGWTEYMSGLHPEGLANMQQAVKLAPSQMDSLKQYVSALAAQPATQPASQSTATRPG